MNDEETIKNLHLYEDEETIQKTIYYLELHDPENANREYAVGFLKFMQRFAHVASRSEGFDFEKFLKEYKTKSRSNQ
ncbi:hypothetical protein FBF28_01665 [Candidatus Saccharibacteria bacterium oral taxon 488]|nr:hypothetical protein FBF28_01665 [Candidatus Saccharibacteria bacterium oral taxon 488]